MEGGAHRLDLGDLGLQQAILGEELESQLTALFGRCALLPAIWDLALLLLDAIVLNEVMESRSGPVLLHAVLLHVGVVHGGARRVKGALCRGLAEARRVNAAVQCRGSAVNSSTHAGRTFH